MSDPEHTPCSMECRECHRIRNHRLSGRRYLVRHLTGPSISPFFKSLSEHINWKAALFSKSPSYVEMYFFLCTFRSLSFRFLKFVSKGQVMFHVIEGKLSDPFDISVVLAECAQSPSS